MLDQVAYIIGITVIFLSVVFAIGFFGMILWWWLISFYSFMYIAIKLPDRILSEEYKDKNFRLTRTFFHLLFRLYKMPIDGRISSHDQVWSFEAGVLWPEIYIYGNRV